MSVEKQDNIVALKTGNALSGWLSTYGLITAARILERCRIQLPQEEITQVILSPGTFYHHLIQVPLKNVLNGIILGQAQDYRIYVEKLFADYFLSEHALEKTEEDQGFGVTEKLEEVRLSFVEMSQTFHQQTVEHRNLIAKTQKHLMEIADQWNKQLDQAEETISERLDLPESAPLERQLRQLSQFSLASQTPASATIDWATVAQALDCELTPDFKEVIRLQIETLHGFIQQVIVPLKEYTAAVSETMVKLIKFRAAFHETILQMHTLITRLPHPSLDLERLEVNREWLSFDIRLGEVGNKE